MVQHANARMKKNGDILENKETHQQALDQFHVHVTIEIKILLFNFQFAIEFLKTLFLPLTHDYSVFDIKRAAHDATFLNQPH